MRLAHWRAGTPDAIVTPRIHNPRKAGTERPLVSFVSLVKLTCGVAFWCSLGLAHAAPDANRVDTGQVNAQLVSEVSHVYPGETITVGLHQRIAPHWHTYWSNPGDSGTATSMDWTLPEGVVAGDIQWPAPHYFAVGPVGNYGYENNVTLLVPITVPSTVQPGASLPLSAKVNWLVCKDICIPQQATLRLDLPVVAKGSPRSVKNEGIGQARSQLPRALPWLVDAERAPDHVALILPPAAAGQGVTGVRFFASEWGQISHNAKQVQLQAGPQFVLQIPHGDAPAQIGDRLKGVLVLTSSSASGDLRQAYALDVALTAPTARSKVVDQPRSADHVGSLGPALLLALLGGLVLNLMPCVFPVLSIKALSLLQHSERSALHSRLHGLAYTAGVLFSFAALAALLIALKAGGAQAGWGFQFQSPVFVLLVAYLMFAVGLNLSGVFDFGSSMSDVGSSLANRQGYAGSFFTGVLATIVATPCTAPFMGGAIGFAMSQPPLALLAVFLSLGFGLALPYLLLSTWPRLQKSLPRPGAWMDWLKQGLAFPMYGAAAWLVWVLAQQAGINAMAVALAGMVALAFGAWVYGRSRSGALLTRRTGAVMATLALLIALTGGTLGIDTVHAGAEPDQAQRHWQPYSQAQFKALRADGQPVFLNFTAAWCITCLVNEKVALNQTPVTEAFQRAGIHYLKGDWTNQDAAISQILSQFGRNGVPLYVYYPKGTGSQPVVLPQLLTPDIVLAVLKNASS